MIEKLRRYLLVLIAPMILLGGCESYRVGDGSRYVLELRARYCAESDPEIRAALLVLIRRHVPGYPGVCLESSAHHSPPEAPRRASAKTPPDL